MAVQMIFYPTNFWGIPLIRKEEVPLGLLGWQGIVPCKTRKMSIAMVNMVTTQLLTVSEVFAKLSPQKCAQILGPKVPGVVKDVIHEIMPLAGSVPGAVYAGMDAGAQKALQSMNTQFVSSLVKSMQGNIDKIFSLQNCVVNQMLQDRRVLGELFRKCGQKELDFLTNSGLWFGFLLGIIQMVVALFWENPWTLSVGGAIVGYLTNWLALKWIFEPVHPTKVGPFVLQGQFLKRQKEVSAEFSKFFASKLLTGEKLWHSIFTDPSTSPAFAAMFHKHFSDFVSRISNSFSMGIDPETIRRAGERALSKLPNHVDAIYPYMDKKLALESTLRTSMEKMSSEQFEQVLHPIFQEDELTLIIAGAVLGLIAGLIQQGLETGQIKAPSVTTFVRSRFNNIARGVRKKSNVDTAGMKGYIIEARTKTVLNNLKADTDRIESVARDMSSYAATISLLQTETRIPEPSQSVEESITQLKIKVELAGRAFRDVAGSSSEMIGSESYVAGANSRASIETLQLKTEKAIQITREVAHLAATVVSNNKIQGDGIQGEILEAITNLGVEAELASAVFSQMAGDIEKVAEAKPYEFSQRAMAIMNNMRFDTQYGGEAADFLSSDASAIVSRTERSNFDGTGMQLVRDIQSGAEELSAIMKEATALSASMCTATTFESEASCKQTIVELQNKTDVASNEARSLCSLVEEVLSSRSYKLDRKLKKSLKNVRAHARNSGTAASSLAGDVSTMASLLQMEDSHTEKDDSSTGPKATFTAEARKLQNDACYARNVAGDLSRDIREMQNALSRGTLDSRTKSLVKDLQLDGERASRAVERLSAKIAGTDLSRLGSRSGRSVEKLQLQAELAAREAKAAAELASELLEASTYELSGKLKRMIKNVQSDAEMASSAAAELAAGSEAIASLAGSR